MSELLTFDGVRAARLILSYRDRRLTCVPALTSSPRNPLLASRVMRRIALGLKPDSTCRTKMREKEKERGRRRERSSKYRLGNKTVNVPIRAHVCGNFFLPLRHYAFPKTSSFCYLFSCHELLIFKIFNFFFFLYHINFFI